MLLTLDIGNTEITVGLFRGQELGAHFRLTTNPDRTRTNGAARSVAF
jgi:Putative transcriptional regulator, homolog of Bvg accessory factor